LPKDVTLDLRLEKVFSLGGRDKVGVFADIRNSLNRSTITAVLTRVPSTEVTTGPGETATVLFDAPGSIIAPRQAEFGLRWSF
jgi:hypothetical protein